MQGKYNDMYGELTVRPEWSTAMSRHYYGWEFRLMTSTEGLDDEYVSYTTKPLVESTDVFDTEYEALENASGYNVNKSK